MMSMRSTVSRILRRGALFVCVAVALVLWYNPHWIDRSVHQVARFEPHPIEPGTEEQRDICRQHGWKPYKRYRKVYDLFMANTELDYLEIRLNTTYDYVDYFVVVESSKTFTGHDRPLTVKENLKSDRFAPYRDKIIYHELEIPPGFSPHRAWDMEDYQRNAMYTQVLARLPASDPRAPAHGDVIIVADVDEILRPQTLLILRACHYPRRLNLRSDFYYYSFQFRHRGPQWQHPQATYYEGWRTILPQDLRMSNGILPKLVKLETADLWSAAWHCSSCFSTIEELLTKMASFSHTNYNEARFRDRHRIAKYIGQGKDLWDRPGEMYDRVENNQDMPPILLEEHERFRYLVDRDGPTAGFTDYP